LRHLLRVADSAWDFDTYGVPEPHQLFRVEELRLPKKKTPGQAGRFNDRLSHFFALRQRLFN
jgi:hypothetical protein